MRESKDQTKAGESYQSFLKWLATLPEAKQTEIKQQVLAKANRQAEALIEEGETRLVKVDHTPENCLYQWSQDTDELKSVSIKNKGWFLELFKENTQWASSDAVHILTMDTREALNKLGKAYAEGEDEASCLGWKLAQRILNDTKESFKRRLFEAPRAESKELYKKLEQLADDREKLTAQQRAKIIAAAFASKGFPNDDLFHYVVKSEKNVGICLQLIVYPMSYGIGVQYFQWQESLEAAFLHYVHNRKPSPSGVKDFVTGWWESYNLSRGTGLFNGLRCHFDRKVEKTKVNDASEVLITKVKQLKGAFLSGHPRLKRTYWAFVNLLDSPRIKAPHGKPIRLPEADYTNTITNQVSGLDRIGHVSLSPRPKH